jgi:hypothetical protein
MPTITPDPYDRLEQLDALAAIKAWLLGDYRRGEERVLLLAIRRDTGLELTDAEMRNVLAEARNDATCAMTALEKLLAMESLSPDEESFVVRPR